MLSLVHTATIVPSSDEASMTLPARKVLQSLLEAGLKRACNNKIRGVFSIYWQTIFKIFCSIQFLSSQHPIYRPTVTVISEFHKGRTSAFYWLTLILTTAGECRVTKNRCHSHQQWKSRYGYTRSFSHGSCSLCVSVFIVRDVVVCIVWTVNVCGTVHAFIAPR
jgi:hypothetical protein